MKIEFTELIVSQAKVLGVMICAGVLVQILWEIKKRSQHKYIAEVMFWAASAAVVSMFMYYCSYGKPSVHGAVGFLLGLLLCRKTCCDIIKAVWVENDEVESSKTTARSSVLKRLENKGWTKDRRKRKEKKNV